MKSHINNLIMCHGQTVYYVIFENIIFNYVKKILSKWTVDAF